MFKDSEKIRAAIFDVDGTLLNSTPMWNKLTFAFAEKMGIAAPDDLFRTLNSLSLEQCAAYYHDVLHVEGTVEEIHEGIIALAREGYAKEVPEITGAAAFLKALSERHIPAAVATASDIASLKGPRSIALICRRTFPSSKAAPPSAKAKSTRIFI